MNQENNLPGRYLFAFILDNYGFLKIFVEQDLIFLWAKP